MKYKITQISDVGTKGMVVNCTCMDEQGVVSQFRGWKSKEFETHDDFRDYTTEVKEDTYNGQTRQQHWIDKPKQYKNGPRGGGMKADPAKIAVEQEKVALEREKQAQFERKWEIDRQSDKWKSCSIVAQVAAKIAQEITATELNTIGGEFDPNKFKAYVSDIAHAIDATVAELYSIQASTAGRQL